jgi:hypothetical protein
MHRIFIALLSFCAFCGSSFADDASSREVAGKLVSMINGPETIRTGFHAVINPMLDGMRQRGAPEAMVTEMKAVYDDWLTNDIKWEELKPLLVNLYIQEFSEKELTELIAFYQSPIGKKMVEKQPLLMQKASQVGQTYATSKQESLQTKMNAVIAKYQPAKPVATP